MKAVTGIVTECQASIISGWKKMSELSGKNDFLVVLEPGEKETSNTILSRESGLLYLEERGVDPSIVDALREPAQGLTPESSAIWVVVIFENQAHVTKLVHQPMSNAGTA
jgi:hypothetical protein